MVLFQQKVLLLYRTHVKVEQFRQTIFQGRATVEKGIAHVLQGSEEILEIVQRREYGPSWREEAVFSKKGAKKGVKKGKKEIP